MNTRIVNIRMVSIFILLAVFITGSYTFSWAGNKKMVEKTVEELDDLNKQAVQQIPDLPENGKVDMKARVKYEKKKPVFDIYYKKTTEKDSTINFNDQQQKPPSQNEETIKNDQQDN